MKPSGILVDSSIWIEYYRADGRVEIQEAVREALRADRVLTVPLVVAAPPPPRIS
ncbi:MAG: hypothetical protein ACOC8K_05840 [Gemmatimonadota bacterium]